MSFQRYGLTPWDRAAKTRALEAQALSIVINTLVGIMPKALFNTVDWLGIITMMIDIGSDSNFLSE